MPNRRALTAFDYDFTINSSLSAILSGTRPALQLVRTVSSLGPRVELVLRISQNTTSYLNFAWTLRGTDRALVGPGVSAAQLFWDGEAGDATATKRSVALVYGTHRPQWPPSLAPDSALHLECPAVNFTLAEQASLGLQQSASPNDVRFVFPAHPALELWTHSSLLTASSSYFRTLFSSDFSEGTKRTWDEHQAVNMPGSLPEEDALEEDADSATDAFLLSQFLPAPTPPPQDHLFYQIRITGAAYTTYRAVLCFLQTGYCPFAPLSSSATSTSSVSPAPVAQEHPSLPLPASPKSIYQLADLLDLPTLSSLALSNLRSQLTISNVATELFSPFAYAHDKPRAVMVAFVLRNRAAVWKSEGFKEAVKRVKKEDPEGRVVLAELVLAEANS
ncbi:hypothetical protein JCM8097_004974 [Rhodosporidiobolus ruineniae]